MNMPTQEKLHKLFTYNGKHLVRKINRGPAKAGEIAGYIDKRLGYRRITCDGKDYLAHRLIWLYVYGEVPHVIDHINRDRTDNRIENLRNVGWHKNARNRAASRRSTTGILGVNLRNGRYRATIGVNGKNIVLGTFDTKAEAYRARLKAELWYWGGTDRSPSLC